MRYLLGGEIGNIPIYNDCDKYFILPLYRWGLCNRLFTLINAIEYIKENNIKKKIKVIWCNNAEVAYENIFDYIEPIENVEHVVECNFNSNHYNRFDKFFYMKTTFTFDKDYKNNLGGCTRYENPNILLIKPNQSIKSEIQKNLNNRKKYISIHIRRRDFGNLVGNDNEIKEKIKKCEYDVYIATDSKSVKTLVSKELGNKIFFDNSNMTINEYRSTTLKISLIDLFTCIYSYKFLMEKKDNHSSTFTGFINIYRKYLHK